MALMNRKSPPPKARTFRLIRCIRVGTGFEFDGSNESKVGSHGQDLRLSRCIRFGSWSESNESNETKASRAQCQDFRRVRFVSAIRFIRCRGTCIGGGCLSLKSWRPFRCIRFIRFGPWSESNESNYNDSKTTNNLYVYT